tara:strand:- start:1656 stop:2012 length:357 start_codon:yes stop_codon:yes gene_type:complete
MEFEKDIDTKTIQDNYTKLKWRSHFNIVFGFLNFFMLCLIAGIVFKELEYAHDTLDEVNELMDEDVTMMDRIKRVENYNEILLILIMRLCKLPGMLHCVPTRNEPNFLNFTVWNQTWG